MLVSRFSRTFTRLIRPKVNQHQDIFHLMRENQSEIALIKQANQRRFETNKDHTLEKELEQTLGISRELSIHAAQQTLHATAYSLSMKPYSLRQTISGSLELDDVAGEIEGRYKPGGANLKFHYSINQDLPKVPQCTASKTRAYIFKLPEGITEKEIMMELGHHFVESVRIEYSILGVPAYAVIDFNSENYLTDRAMQQEVDIFLNDKSYRLSTEVDNPRLQLTSRQLVLNNISAGETPATMLRFFSNFGHVMHLDLPMEIYREQSLQEIKDLYSGQTEPVRINLHKTDGTIESEFYPPLETSKHEDDFIHRKHEEYKRRLRYCENIDVYEGKAGEVTIKPKGYCTVTFSCLEEAQNCYFHLRNTRKVELKNGREDFEFDKAHRQALLRHIDNQYIEQCMKNNPLSKVQNFNRKLGLLTYQSFYLNLVYEENRRHMYDYGTQIVATQNYDDKTGFAQYHEYKTTIEKFKNQIGKDSFQDQFVNNGYGKSFDQLAQQELYGAKLSKKRFKRYEVNVDDYIRDDPNPIKTEEEIKKIKMGYRNMEKPQKEINQSKQQRQDESEEEELQYKVEDDEENKDLDDEEQDYYGEAAGFSPPQTDENDYVRGRYFSTFRQPLRTIPKTLQQKVRSHLKYNQFVRNTLNEYMGIFSAQKLQREFGRQKPSFANPQNLRFLDGSDFLPEAEVKNALEASAFPDQEVYNIFVKQNETIKSLNIDVEEIILKDFENNQNNLLRTYTDVGKLEEEFEFTGQNIEEVVQELNLKEADIGEEYRAITKPDGTQSIAKIVKLEEIVPLRSVEKCKQYLAQTQDSENDTSSMNKYFDGILNGEPLNEEAAQFFNLQPGTVVDVQSVLQELSTEIGVPIKDFEKMLNIQNFTKEQIERDISQQEEISKVRRKIGAKRAVDYSRDPSDIKARGEDGKFVPSKFRQM